MTKEPKTQVENVYQSKEEKELAEGFQRKLAQLICKQSDRTGVKYRLKK